MNVNKHGEDWLQIKGWLTEELEDARLHVETFPSHPDSANFYRGRCDVIRQLLREVEPEPTPEVEDVNYG